MTQKLNLVLRFEKNLYNQHHLEQIFLNKLGAKFCQNVKIQN